MALRDRIIGQLHLIEPETRQLSLSNNPHLDIGTPGIMKGWHLIVLIRILT